METETPIFPPADQQLALLEIEDLWPLLTEEQQRKRYTGEQFAKNQRLYRAIALLLGDGWSVIGIARELGCAEKLVRCIDSRESCVVSEVKSRFGRKFLQVAAKAVRRTDEQLPHMSGKDAGIVAGIFTEKGLMLMGELGEKAVVKGDGMSREEFAAWLAASVPGGPVIDVPPVPPTPVPTGADGRSPDSESGGIVLNGQESWLSAPAVASLVAAPAPESGQVAPATAGGAEAGATGTGGGGVCRPGVRRDHRWNGTRRNFLQMGQVENKILTGRSEVTPTAAILTPQVDGRELKAVCSLMQNACLPVTSSLIAGRACLNGLWARKGG